MALGGHELPDYCEDDFDDQDGYRADRMELLQEIDTLEEQISKAWARDPERFNEMLRHTQKGLSEPDTRQLDGTAFIFNVTSEQQ